MVRILLAAIIGLVAVPCVAEEIPLKSVWAYQMPGTRGFCNGEPNKSPTAVDDILAALSEGTPATSKSSRGFILNGAGVDELRTARSVLDGSEKPRYRFSSNDEINVVFFSRECGQDFHIKGATRKGTRLTVHYIGIPHKSGNTSPQFAIIPFGKLSPEKYHVAFIPATASGQNATSKVPPNVVSGSFNFVVE
ncbi:hypothetical protein [Lacipirellula parvula]|uniref:Uncharacterized protein n=1 Tax=Lacipirellula parvula TaxID=2650471 RepID=A0A5K7XDT8_9BACT|nr:hypothetical protein [Lacipirellula parvula]BBO34565.1 hypothetical protein PLANPX_4177 [Lacipirellula parvula]